MPATVTGSLTCAAAPVKVAMFAGLTAVADVAAGAGARLLLPQAGALAIGATVVAAVDVGATSLAAGGAGTPGAPPGAPPVGFTTAVISAVGIVKVIVLVTGGWATVMTVVVNP